MSSVDALPELEVKLESSIKLESEGLRVAYTLHNNSGGDVGVFNCVPLNDSKGEISLATENTYTDLDGSLLQLRKMLLPLPQGFTVAVRKIPYVALMSNQQTIREEFIIPIPVVVNHPYRRAALTVGRGGGVEVVADEMSDADTVEFSVGLFKREPEMKFIPVGKEYPNVYRVAPHTSKQVVLSHTERLRHPVPVKDYRVVPRS